MPNKLYFKDITAPNDTKRFALAMEYLKEHPNTHFYIESGTYEITTQHAVQTMREVTCGYHGENPQKFMFSPNYEYDIGLDFSGQSGTVVHADDVRLMINGFMEPLSLKNCDNITVNGLTIDHVRKPYSKGVVIDVEIVDGAESRGFMTVKFDDRDPVSNKTIMPRTMFADPKCNKIYYRSYKILSREFLGNQTFKFEVQGLKSEFLGLEFYIWHSFHSRPAILIENAKNITLENVTIHSQPGMGIVGHLSENIRINALRVIPSEGDCMSTNTDATHFASCRGSLIMENCTFKGQGDDSVNVHTYYHKAEKIADGSYKFTCLALDGTHTQKCDLPRIGDRLCLVKTGTLEPMVTCVVKEILSVDGDGMHFEARLDKDLPENTGDFYVYNADACPDFVFRNCRASAHIARSVLVKTESALIENCVFENVRGTPIEIAAEERWGEATVAKRVIIRQNTMINCADDNIIRIKNSGGIAVFCDSRDQNFIHDQNIVIENNRILCKDSPQGIYVQGASNVTLSGNEIVSSGESIVIENCENVVK